MTLFGKATKNGHLADKSQPVVQKFDWDGDDEQFITTTKFMFSVGETECNGCEEDRYLYDVIEQLISNIALPTS